MSCAENWKAIQDRHMAAVTVAKQVHEGAVNTMDVLREGVDISVAHRIITEHWGEGAVAANIRTRLYAEFPKSNGRVLMDAALSHDDLMRWRGDRTEVMTYFELIHQYILDGVQRITEKLNQTEGLDDEALLRYNEFRANVLRYVGYIDGYYYSVREILESDDVNDWETVVQMIPVDEVSNGDYLFMDDFLPILTKVQGKYLERELHVDNTDRFAVSDMEWLLRKLIPHIKIPFLFAQYLNTWLLAE